MNNASFHRKNQLNYVGRKYGINTALFARVKSYRKFLALVEEKISDLVSKTT